MINLTKIKNRLNWLVFELSPENLTCDGELSQAESDAREAEIRAEWKELERKFGQTVSEEEAMKFGQTRERNHYDWLEDHFLPFAVAVNVRGAQLDGNGWVNKGIIVAHGDKAYGYKDAWEKAGVPFDHGVAIFMLSYCHPYSDEVRETDKGWVNTCQWVIDNYSRFKEQLLKAETA